MRHRPRKLHFHRHAPQDKPVEGSLNALRTGEKGIVTGITGGRKMLERLTSLGFVPGTEVIILHNFGHGPIIVRAHDARVALGRGVAGRVKIRRSEA